MKEPRSESHWEARRCWAAEFARLDFSFTCELRSRESITSSITTLLFSLSFHLPFSQNNTRCSLQDPSPLRRKSRLARPRLTRPSAWPSPVESSSTSPPSPLTSSRSFCNPTTHLHTHCSM